MMEILQISSYIMCFFTPCVYLEEVALASGLPALTALTALTASLLWAVRQEQTVRSDMKRQVSGPSEAQSLRSHLITGQTRLPQTLPELLP